MTRFKIGLYFYFPRSDDIKTLKSLLELMMQFSPQTATKILDMAKHLANVMHMKSSGENPSEDNTKCEGVEYLVHLGKILAKSVSGCQDVDTTHCQWNELPTIPTKKEIFSSKVVYLLSLNLHDISGIGM
jgi:hypothetical protein